MTTTTTPRVYVGTYGKYNSGSIAGKWFDLEDYASKDDFEEACQEFHGPGEHEFMFQDHEGIPEGLISESFIDPYVWDWIALDDDDREMVSAFGRCFGSDEDIDTIREACQGKADSETDYAEQYADNVGLLDSIPDNLRYYFDFEQFGRDLFINELIRDDETGYIFDRNW